MMRCYHNNGTWNKQTSTILARKPVAGKSPEMLQTTKLNRRDSFCLEGLVGGIGIIFPDIFLKPCIEKLKRGNLEVYICAWLSRCGSFGITSVLQQLRATSTCCILSFYFIGETSVLKFLQPFFLVTVRPTAGQSQRSYSMLNLWVSPDFHLASVSFFEDENWQEVFLRFGPDIDKDNLTRTKANLRWNNQTENSSRAQIKYHTAILIMRCQRAIRG